MDHVLNWFYCDEQSRKICVDCLKKVRSPLPVLWANYYSRSMIFTNVSKISHSIPVEDMTDFNEHEQKNPLIHAEVGKVQEILNVAFTNTNIESDICFNERVLLKWKYKISWRSERQSPFIPNSNIFGIIIFTTILMIQIDEKYALIILYIKYILMEKKTTLCGNDRKWKCDTRHRPF